MADAVDQFDALAIQLTNEAVAYAAAGEYNEATDFNIRRVRIRTQVLMAALLQAQVPRPVAPPQGGPS